MSTLNVTVTFPTARVNPSDPPFTPAEVASTQILGSLAGAGVVTIGQITGDGTTFSAPILPGDWVITATVTDVEGNVSAPSNAVSVTVPPSTLSAPEPPTISVTVS